MYGGIITGFVAAYVYARWKRQPFLTWADCVAPGLLVMQAIARWGNFFNQELYGPPTDLPWGIAIDCEHRTPALACPPLGDTPVDAHFHPLFLYESISGAIGAVVLLYLARRVRWFRPGDIVLLFFMWYGTTRFVLETFRTNNWTFFDFPVASIISAAFVLGAAAVFAWRHRPGARAGEADKAEKAAALADDVTGAADGSALGMSGRRRRAAANIRPDEIRRARGEVKEGLDWLGKPPDIEAGLVFRTTRFVARVVLLGICGFRVDAGGREHLPAGGGYILLCAVHRGWVDPFLVLDAVPGRAARLDAGQRPVGIRPAVEGVAAAARRRRAARLARRGGDRESRGRGAGRARARGRLLDVRRGHDRRSTRPADAVSATVRSSSPSGPTRRSSRSPWPAPRCCTAASGSRPGSSRPCRWPSSSAMRGPGPRNRALARSCGSPGSRPRRSRRGSRR